MILKKLILLLPVFFCGSLCAQNIDIKVIDHSTGEPIAFAEVFSEGIAVQADINGELTFPAESFPLQLEIRALGFQNQKIEIPSAVETWEIKLRPKPESLSAVLIQSVTIPGTLQEAAAAVNVLTEQDIERTPEFVITESFNRAPGVMVQQGALNTQKIVIRGMGARAQYGTNRVKAYFEGIPLTTGDGATTIEDLDPEAIKRIEILKGPVSSVYGAGLGGVVNLYAADAPPEGSTAKIQYLGGSFELQKKTISAAHGDERRNFFASYNELKTEGFRENSDYNRKNFILNGSLNHDNGNKLSFLASYTNLKAYIPSSINEEDFLEEPSSAAYTWAAARGYESYDKAMMGLAYKTSIADKLENRTSVFFNIKNADEPRPFDILKEEQVALGARTRFNYSGNLLEIPSEASLGAEFYNEWYNISTFENLYEDFPDQGSVLGEILSNNKQQRQYLNVFGQVNFSFSKKWKLEAGLNLNTTNYNLQDLYVQDEVDQTGDYTFNSILSPRIGATYTLAESKTLYATISHGFSVPNVEETLTPEGSINTSLQAETGINYEIGMKANWFGNRLYTEVAAYSIQVDNLLVAQRIAEDQYVGINAGQTNHTGIELQLNYSWNPITSLEIKPYASASFNFYEFDEFVDDDNDYSGNELTGVPDKSIYLGVDAITDFGLSFYGTFNHVGAIPLNDANDLYTESYQVLNLKIMQRIPLFQQLQIKAIAGVNNVLDEHYAASILTNAIGFGGSAPRYYYPGDPRNFYAGLSLNWNF